MAADGLQCCTSNVMHRTIKCLQIQGWRNKIVNNIIYCFHSFDIKARDTISVDSNKAVMWPMSYS